MNAVSGKRMIRNAVFSAMSTFSIRKKDLATKKVQPPQQQQSSSGSQGYMQGMGSAGGNFGMDNNNMPQGGGGNGGSGPGDGSEGSNQNQGGYATQALFRMVLGSGKQRARRQGRFGHYHNKCLNVCVLVEARLQKERNLSSKATPRLPY